MSYGNDWKKAANRIPPQICPFIKMGKSGTRRRPDKAERKFNDKLFKEAAAENAGWLPPGPSDLKSEVAERVILVKYTGIVVRLYRDGHYKINYTDNDSEDMTWLEVVSSALCLNPKQRETLVGVPVRKSFSFRINHDDGNYCYCQSKSSSFKIILRTKDVNKARELSAEDVVHF